MTKYIIKRILIAIPVLLGITVIDYAIMCMAGSPLEMLQGPRVSEAAVQAKAIALGLDKPFYVHKKEHPKRFCDVGIFRLVRCPNYLGEVLIWTGVFVSGVTALHGSLQWIAALAGWICIVYIMFGGARRLELRQNKNYGDDPDYQQYVKTVPILLPFIPLYSVAKYKWLVG